MMFLSAGSHYNEHYTLKHYVGLNKQSKFLLFALAVLLSCVKSDIIWHNLHWVESIFLGRIKSLRWYCKIAHAEKCYHNDRENYHPSKKVWKKKTKKESVSLFRARENGFRFGLIKDLIKSVNISIEMR